MRRFVLAAGYAASEVGAVMVILSLIALAAGAKFLLILVDVVLLAGLGIWLWSTKSRIAAVLMLILVGYEYFALAATRPDSLGVRTYPILFLVALLAHGRKSNHPVVTGAPPPG